MIWNAILKLTWFIFVQGPLSLINEFNKVLEYLTGGIINDILFGSAQEFQWNNIPGQFWWFVIIAICLLALVFTIQMIILIFKETIATKTKFVLAVQNAVKSFIFIFLIPIFFFLANFIVQNIANTIINNFSTNSNIAQYLWHIGDPKWDGTANNTPTHFDPPGNINDYNMIAQLFGTWFMLFAVLMIGLILIQKIIELFFLFVISPIVMIVMVVDDGKAVFTWKDMVGAKFLASTATLIGYYIFISVTQILLSSGLSGLDSGGLAKALFIILFLCGGAMATMAFSDIVALFIGESVGLKEGLSSMRTTMAGGMMALGAGKMALKGIGFAKSKRAGNFPGLDNRINPLNSFSDNDDEDDNNQQGAQKLNFATFKYANTGLASRSGILGLTGLTLGASTVGLSHFLAKRSAGSSKIGFKNLRTSISRTFKRPLKKIIKPLNPGLINFSKAKIKNERIKTSNNHIKEIIKQINQQKQLIKSQKKNNPDSITKNEERLKKLQQEKQKLYQKKAKYKIPDINSKYQKKQRKNKEKNMNKK